MKSKLLNIFFACALTFSMVPLSSSSAIAEEEETSTQNSSQRTIAVFSTGSDEGAASEEIPEAEIPEEEIPEAVIPETSTAIPASAFSGLADQVDFNQSAEVDGVVVQVSAAPGVFPAGSTLHVQWVPAEDAPEVDAAVQRQRADSTNTALAYNFDIAVLDAEGTEVQPAEGANVHVSFTLAAVANENLDTQVYHVTEAPAAGASQDAFVAQPLPVEVDEALETATVVTDGFSYYTVEFTYGDLTYVMEGDTEVPLSEIMDHVGLTGEVTNVETSNPELFSAYQKQDGAWYVVAHQAFDSDEWMKLTIDGLNFGIEFLVTDDSERKNLTPPSGFENQDIATITLDYSKIKGVTPTLTASSGRNGFTFSQSGGKITASNSAIRYGGSDSNGFVAAGSFTVTYSDAAVFPDGSRGDVEIVYSAIQLATNVRDASGAILPSGTYADTITFFNNSGTAAGMSGLPDLNLATASQRIGARIDMQINITGTGGAAHTFIYTGFDFNIDRSGTGFNQLANYSANSYWSEGFSIPAGASVGSAMNSYSYPSISNGYTASGSGGKSYASGFGVTTSPGVSHRIYSGVGGGASIDAYLLSDGITHTTTSSSGNYGKIELWTDGKTDVTGSSGKQLYGGRYEPTIGVDEKRTYDVPDGKVVQYKLTPEDGYILDTLTTTGSGTLTAYFEDGTFMTVSDATNPNFTYTESPIDYYIYEFSASDITDQTIHVTWKPAIQIDATKVWNDKDTKYRPTSVDFTLDGAGNGAIGTKRSLNGGNNWTTTYYNLPKYSSYTSATDTGTDIIKYTVSESNITGGVPAMYVEIEPHTITKADSKKSAQYIVDNDSDQTDHYSFTTETIPDYDKRTVDYKITNRAEYFDIWVEKETDPNSAADTFTYDIALTYPDGSTETKTLNVAAGQRDVLKDIPKGTTYTITEQSKAKWTQVEYETKDCWSTGSEAFFGSGGTYYSDKDSTASYTVPAGTPPADEYYEYLGLQTDSGESTYDCDGGTIDWSEYSTTGIQKTITYSNYDVDAFGNYIAYVGTASDGSNVSVKTSDIYATKSDYHYYKNQKLVDLTVSKTVSGNQGSKDKYFKIDIDIKDAAKNTEYSVDVSNMSATVGSNSATQPSYVSKNNFADIDDTTNNKIKTDANGNKSMTIYLQHGQSIAIKDLPYSANYTVTETQEDYKASGVKTVTDTSGTKTTTAIAGNTDTSGTAGIQDDTLIAFTNTRNGAIPTEIRVPGWESFMLLFIAMLGLALLAMRRNRTVKEVAHERRASQFPVRSSQKYAKAMRKTQPKHERST